MLTAKGMSIVLGISFGLLVILSIIIFDVFGRIFRKIKLLNKRRKGELVEFEPKKLSFVSPLYAFLLTIALAGIVMFLPYYWDYFAVEPKTAPRIFKMVLLSIHNTVRLFILDGDFQPIVETVAFLGEGHTLLKRLFTVYAAALYILAPAMTARFLFTLFKDVFNYTAYQHFRCAKEVYLISELNERSIELAKDILSEERIRKEVERSIPAPEANEEGEIDEKQEKKYEALKKKAYAKARRKNRIIVFADVFEKSEEKSFELVLQARRLGAYCFKRDIVDVGLKRHWIKGATQKIYFIGENEDENVEQALLMIESCVKVKKFNHENVHFYIFATTVESEALIDSVDNGNMTVRRINENKNLVYATLYDPLKEKMEKDAERETQKKRGIENESILDETKEGAETFKTSVSAEDIIFNHAICENVKAEENGQDVANVVYKLRILIVGLGNYGMELLKTLCWTCQMMRHELEIYVFDKEKDARDRIAKAAPDLIAHNGKRIDGMPYYEIVFGGEECLTNDAGQILKNSKGEPIIIDNGTDVRTRGFYQKLDKILGGSISAAYVTLGEDELNIETAMGLRAYFWQKSQNGGQSSFEHEKLPPIYPVVYSSVKNRIYSKNCGLRSYNQRSYGITFIGNISKRYSLNAIEQTDLYEAGRAIHMSYGGAGTLETVREFFTAITSLLDKKNVAARTPERMENFLKETLEKIKEKIEKWDKELKKLPQLLLERHLVKEGELSLDEGVNQEDDSHSKSKIDIEFLMGLLDRVHEALSITPNDEWLEDDEEFLEKYLRMIQDRNEHIRVKNSIGRALREGGSLLENCLKECKEKAKILVDEWEEKVRECEKAYRRYEYHRNSSMATAMHKEFRDFVWEKYGWTRSSKEDEEYEHKRWIVYLWSEGYRQGQFKSQVAKTHTGLVPVEERSLIDRGKTTGIVKGLTVVFDTNGQSTDDKKTNSK